MEFFRSSKFRRALRIGAIAAGIGLIGIGAWIWHIDSTWSPVIEPILRQRNQLGSIRLLARDASGKDQWFGSLTSGRTEERQPLTLAQVPPLMTQAIVSLEDPRFLEHGGFDPWGIARAMYSNLKSFRYAQGGSTITQQLVKNVFLTNEKTLSRKFIELVLSALVEKRFTKDEILEAYMNEVYLGQLGSVEIHGVGRASEYYFGKKVTELEVQDLALIAAMIAGPGVYSPWNHPERARARRDRVLKTLAEGNFILPQELASALSKPLPTKPSFIAAAARSGYMLDAVREELLASHTEVEILRGGFDFRLHLNPELQGAAEEVLRKKATEWAPGTQGLFIAADPRTCRIRAYIGGTDYRVTQLDRIRQSRRPIGSLMKPLETVPLLDEDPTLNLATTLEDRPLKWSYDKGHGTWSPTNYDGKFRGKITLRKTLEDSINVPIVRIFFEREPTGMLTKFFDPVRAYGLTIPEERALPSALLGAVDQTPRDVLTAYLRLVRQAMGIAQDAGDFACRLSFEEPLTSPETTPAPPPTTGPGVRQKGAILALTALQGAIRRGTGISLGSRLPIEQAWASKTGTSNDKRDSWYVLMSPDMVYLAWVGRDDNQETPFTGASGALPVVAPLVVPPKPAKGESPAPVTAWNWPTLEGELEWVPYDVDGFCIPADDVLSDIHFNTKSPQGGTPPPDMFELKGKKYLYELFRKDARPPRCP